MDIAALLEFADAWAGLGSAVQRQTKEVLDLFEMADVNPAAIELAHERLARAALGYEDEAPGEIVALLGDWLNGCEER